MATEQVETVNELDYAKLWRTLLRLGIKQRFSQIRSEFFMKIASDGLRKFQGQEDMDTIIEESEVFKNSPELLEYFKKAIAPTDEFKHYTYHTDDSLLQIEYFANLTSEVTKDFIEYHMKQKAIDTTYDIDGCCVSSQYVVNLRQETEEGEPEEVTESRTSHFIIIWEVSPTINPDTYPAIIKHELAHTCLFETIVQLKDEGWRSMRVPAAWTDAEIEQWHSDVKELTELLLSHTSDAEIFEEFVADFLMYESDGQTKEKNPIQESRVPKATSPNAKPKVTYRTLSPIDRFEEHLDDLNEEQQLQFQKIVNALRSQYDEYDKFLDDIKMS